MDDDRHGVRSIFGEAAEITSAPELAAYLERACGGDAELRREVERLLQSLDQAGSFLEASSTLGEKEYSADSALRSEFEFSPDQIDATELVLTGIEPLPTLLIDDGTTMIERASVGAPTPADRPTRLQIFGEIARGGMGVVLRGHDPALGRDLAVKVLRDEFRDNPEMARRFVEEAQIAGQLQHPGIVPIHELGVLGDDRPYFTMKLVKGGTFSHLLEREKSSEANWARFLGIYEQICQTVAYAHSHGVIHRDLKPSNVMVGNFGEVQVMDWGLAKVLSKGVADDGTAARAGVLDSKTIIATVRSLSDSDLSSAGSVLGTPSYMAPEQARGEVERIDERVDVFALGSILCEILTGQPVFVGHMGDILLRAAAGDLGEAWLRLDGCGGDAELLALARDCLQPDREARPRDAGVVTGRLTAYLAGVQEKLRTAEVERAAEAARAQEAIRTAEAARSQARAERRARKLTAALAAASLGLVAIVGVGGAWIQRQAAVTTRLVGDAIGEALRREGEARTRSADDPAGWDAPLVEAHRADDLLKQGWADAGLRRRVDSLLASLERQRNEVKARAVLYRVDRILIADLDAAKNSTHFDASAVDRAYAEAFKAAGLDLDRTEPRAIGEWVAARPARDRIVVYVDDWAYIRRLIKLGPGQHSDAEIVAAARVADPDPWRDQLRAAHHDPTALRALADDEPGLEGQPARSLHLLAIALKDEARDWDRGVRVLRLAWRRFPNDFWINLELATFMKEKSKASPPNQQARWREDQVRFLTAAVAAWPQSVWARYELGYTLVELERPEEALEAYRGATRLRPGTAPYTSLGQSLRLQNKIKEAEAALREAILTGPGDAEAHWELGIVLRMEGKLGESLSQLREATRLKPENASYHYQYGRSFESSGRLDEAIAAFREAILIDSKTNHVGMAYYSLVQSLRRAGRQDEAIAVLNQALRLKPNEVRPHEVLADILTQQRRWTEALKQLVEISQVAPSNDSRLLQIAILALHTGDEVEYRRNCLAMLERLGGATTGPLAVRTYFSCLLSRKPVELERASRLAQADFDSGRAAKPGTQLHSLIYSRMALAEYRNGRFAQADKLLREVRPSEESTKMRIDSLLAMTCLRLGLEEESRRRLADCRNALRVGIGAAGQPQPWTELLVCELFCREAEALMPGGSATSGRGPKPSGTAVLDLHQISILVEAGRFDEAIAILRDAVDHKPDDILARRSLGDHLAKRGRWAEALKVLEKAIELDPSDDKLWHQVATLQLYLGDDAGYRRRCVAMFDRFAKIKGVSLARTTKCSMMSSRPVELGRAVELARESYSRALASNPKAEHLGWNQLDWALAEYRSGHFEIATENLKKCRAAGGVLGLQAEALLAMSYHRLGLKLESARLLAACREALREIAVRPSGGGEEWHDYLDCELFCREVEALICEDTTRPAEAKPSDTPGASIKRPSTTSSGAKP